MANATTKSINKIISNLKRIKKSSEKIDYWFFRYSLQWIKERANALLDQRTNGYNSSQAREWTITYSRYNAKLENLDPNSGAIEFGIGIVGQEQKHESAKNDPHIVASENNYIYNQSSKYKNSEGGWNFYLPNGTLLVNFKGYGGKSFLYDSFMEYVQKDLHLTMYKRAFDKVMKSVIKK